MARDLIGRGGVTEIIAVHAASVIKRPKLAIESDLRFFHNQKMSTIKKSDDTGTEDFLFIIVIIIISLIQR